MAAVGNMVLQSVAAAWEESDHMHVWALVLIVTLLLLCIVLGHLLEESRFFNEATIAILLGLVSGALFIASGGSQTTSLLHFDTEIFFIYLLPPIIFNAGFSVKKKQFFRNFFPIILYGVVGVFVSTAVITAAAKITFPRFGIRKLTIADYLALGTIFSATDSVCVLQILNQDETPLLYSLVFGEGVVNDATTVVLFRAFQTFNVAEFSAGVYLNILLNFVYLLLASTALGVGVGLLSAYTIKRLYLGKHSTDREIAVMILMAYLSYIMAEMAQLSSILTVFFCGIVMSHYTWHNVTESSRITTRHAFATMSFIAETFIFLYVGLDGVEMTKWKQTHSTEALGMFSVLLIATLVGRAAFVFPISAIANRTRGSNNRITIRHQIIIWWSGLMRGAVSIALAYSQFSQSGDTQNPEHATVIATTMAVVLFSTLAFGSVSKPIIEWVLPHHLRHIPPPTPPPGRISRNGRENGLAAPLLSGGSYSGGSMDFDLALPISSLTSGPSVTALLAAPSGTAHRLWRAFDNKFMRPSFGGFGFSPIEREEGTETSHRVRRSDSTRLVPYQAPDPPTPSKAADPPILE